MITKWLLRLNTLICAISIAACSSNNEESLVPSFPDKQTLEVAAGETHVLTFTAERPWRMTSDKAWVRFLMGETTEELPVAYGCAGENTVTIVMKQNGWTFDTESAQLSLTMDGHTQPIFELKRPAKERSVKMKVKYHTQQPKYENSINIAYADRTRYQVGFEANFDWKVVSIPKWLRPLNAITGEADTPADKLERIAVADEWVPYGFEDTNDPGNAIILADRSGEHTFTFTFTFEGLPDDVLSLMPKTTLAGGIQFYYDRRLMNDGLSSSGPSQDREAFISEIETRNLDYTLKYVSYDVVSKTVREITPTEAWFKVKPVANKAHSYEISIKNDADYQEWDDRSQYLFIFPPKYKDDGYDYASVFDETGNLNREKNKYGIQIKQLGKRLEGYVLTGGYSLDISIADPIRVEDPALIEKYGTANLYEKTFTEEEWSVKGQIQVQANGLWEMRHEFTDWSSWMTSQPSISAYRLVLGSHTTRKSFAELPQEASPIFFKNSDGSTYGVLLIQKQM